jgi:hypothetical protein
MQGSYVGGDRSNAYLLELAQTSEDRLVGRVERLRVDAAGQWHQAGASLEGEFDGEAAVLILRPTDFSDLPLVLWIRQIPGGGLTAIGEGVGVGGVPLALSEGGRSQFETLAAGLAPVSPLAPSSTADPLLAASCGCSEQKKARAAEATRKFTIQVDLLVDGMEEAMQAAQLHRHEIQRLAGHGAVELRPGLAALEIALQKVRTSFDRDLGDAETACRQRAPMPGVPMPPEAEQWNAACERLADKAVRYRVEMGGLESDMRELEAASAAR